MMVMQERKSTRPITIPATTSGDTRSDASPPDSLSLRQSGYSPWLWLELTAGDTRRGAGQNLNVDASVFLQTRWIMLENSTKILKITFFYWFGDGWGKRWFLVTGSHFPHWLFIFLNYVCKALKSSEHVIWVSYFDAYFDIVVYFVHNDLILSCAKCQWGRPGVNLISSE